MADYAYDPKIYGSAEAIRNAYAYRPPVAAPVAKQGGPLITNSPSYKPPSTPTQNPLTAFPTSNAPSFGNFLNGKVNNNGGGGYVAPIIPVKIPVVDPAIAQQQLLAQQQAAAQAAAVQQQAVLVQQQQQQAIFAKQIQDAVGSYKPIQAVNNSGDINQMYADTLKGLIAANQGKVNQGVSDQNALIQGVGQKYQPDINNSEVQKFNQIRSVLEQAANNGDRGGNGRQNALMAQASGDNSVNNIRLAIQGVKDTANKNIADLQAMGRTDELQMTSDNSAQRIRDLIGEGNRVDSINRSNNETSYNHLVDSLKTIQDQNNSDRNYNYGVNRDAINDASDAAKTKYTQEQNKIITDRTAANDKIAKETAATESVSKAQTEKEAKFIATIGQYYNDFQAQIDNVANNNDPTDDWTLPFLRTARVEKEQNMAKEQKITDQQNVLDTERISKNQGESDYNASRIKAIESGIAHAGDSANNAANVLAWAKDPNNPANSKINSNTGNTVDDYSSTIIARFTEKPNENNGYQAVQDTAGIRAYLLQLVEAGVPRTIVDSLGARYGIQ